MEKKAKKSNFKIPFRKIFTIKNFLRAGVTILIVAALALVYLGVRNFLKEGGVVRKINTSLKAKPHNAQILIKANTLDEKSGKIKTTIKFQELNVINRTLGSQIFTFEGSSLDLITLVVSVDKDMVKAVRGFRGGKALLFMKIIAKDGESSTEFDLVQPNTVPLAYQVKESEDLTEKAIWSGVWKEILDGEGNLKPGFKITPIPLSNSYFLPGTIFDLTLDSDGEVEVQTKHPSYWRSERK